MCVLIMLQALQTAQVIRWRNAYLVRNWAVLTGQAWNSSEHIQVQNFLLLAEFEGEK